MTTNKGGLCRLFTVLLCSCSLALSGCSFIGSSGHGSEKDTLKTEFTLKSEKHDRKGQPTVETEIVVDSQSSQNEESSYSDDIAIPAAAEYFLSSADENTVRCYKAIYGGLYNYSEEIDLPDNVLHKDDIGALMTLVICTAPEINQISSEYNLVVDSSGYISDIKVSYAKDKEQGDAELAQLKAEVASICSKAEGMDTYQKIKFFHDTVILKCTYSDEDKNAYSAYGCLIEGKAVCEGYSKAMLMLCEYAGIDCIPVMGTANPDDPIAHMWNKVNIDGEWYNIDVTWDDPISNLGDDYLRYDYFNITDTACQSDHVFEENKYMKYPPAESESSNYFVKSQLLIENSADAADTVEKAIIQSAENGDRYVRIKCADRQLFDSVCTTLFDSSSKGNIFLILCSANSKTNGLVSSDSYSVMKNENACTFTLIIN